MQTDIMGRTNAPMQIQFQPAVPLGVYDVLRAFGRPLAPAVRAFMESRFGHDFSGIRVHTGCEAAASARALGARAYTVGRHVVFAAGQYAPHTEDGIRLLAHELTHALQQGPVRFVPANLLLDPGSSAAEQEAQSVAEFVVRGERCPAIAVASVAPMIQRATIASPLLGIWRSSNGLTTLYLNQGAQANAVTGSINDQNYGALTGQIIGIFNGSSLTGTLVLNNVSAGYNQPMNLTFNGSALYGTLGTTQITFSKLNAAPPPTPPPPPPPPPPTISVCHDYTIFRMTNGSIITAGKAITDVVQKLAAMNYQQIASLSSLSVKDNTDRFAELPMNSRDVFVMTSGNGHSGFVNPGEKLDHYLQQVNLGLPAADRLIPIDQPGLPNSGVNTEWSINGLYASISEATDTLLRTDRPNLKRDFSFAKMLQLQPGSQIANVPLTYYSTIGFVPFALLGQWIEQTNAKPDQMRITSVGPQALAGSYIGLVQNQSQDLLITSGGFDGFTIRGSLAGRYGLQLQLRIDDYGYQLSGMGPAATPKTFRPAGASPPPVAFMPVRAAPILG